MRSALWLVVALAAALVALPRRVNPSTQEKTSRGGDGFFVAKVAPVLRERCLECHNAKKSRGGLDLTTREQTLTGGDKGPAVVPGDAGKSLLLHMVDGREPKMPWQRPALSAQQIADLRKWIDDGAAWPKSLVLAASGAGEKTAADWWSLRPLQRPPLPAVKDSAWVHNPIDAFILAMLEAKGLGPSGPTDRLTFIRRVTYDLHGLPPTPAETDAFVSDTAPDASERLIDRLLASPRYGERWGRHWLDIVHYADTHGYDKDKKRLWAWLFRDWVIRAFNRDLPYRRFVRQQLAGDVLLPDDPDGVIATGFVVAGPWDFVGHVELREGTVDKEKTRLLDRDDMVANTISTFTSLTAHCARCHDHKFDPIPQKDYYRLQAVFAGVERGDRVHLSPAAQGRRLTLERQLASLKAERDRLWKKAEASMPAGFNAIFDKEVTALREKLARLPRPVGTEKSPTNGYHSAISATPTAEKWVQVDLGKVVPIDTIRLIPARPTDFRDTPGFGFPVRFRVAIADEPTFANAKVAADCSEADFPNPGDNPYTIRLAGTRARYVRITATRLWERTKDYVFALAELEVDSAGKNRARGAAVTALDSIEAGRWAKKNLVDGYDSRNRLPDLTADAKAAAIVKQREELEREIRLWQLRREYMLLFMLDGITGMEFRRIDGEVSKLTKAIESLPKPVKVYAVVPRSPRPIHVLHRGDVERKGELATPGALSSVPGLDPIFKLPKVDDEASRRLALADWITDDRNMLTWRSIVNRVWHYHFGRGLVDTPNDFGKNGSQPTHPELLDWLAVEFRDGGQSFKRLHRLILLSNTYRQSSAHDAAKAKIDADNRALWRMNRQRLDAESIRDSVLAVSGKLDRTMGGPGFELFRFKDDHSPVYDHTALEKINDPATWRRTVYRFVVRSVPNPFLESLDCADPNLNVPVRNTTLTALQALALLNNPFMVKQSEHFARRLEGMAPDMERRVEMAYRLAFGRMPTREERAAVANYARRHGLVNACRVLLNANEFLFID